MRTEPRRHASGGEFARTAVVALVAIVVVAILAGIVVFGDRQGRGVAVVETARNLLGVLLMTLGAIRVLLHVFFGQAEGGFRIDGVVLLILAGAALSAPGWGVWIALAGLVAFSARPWSRATGTPGDPSAD